MRRLIIFLIFLVASVWFGVTVLRHPGYLLLVYQPWMVQMPLWFALISLLIIFGLFYLLIDSIDRIHFFYYRLKNWMKLRREHKAYSNTQLGLTNLIEGRWRKSEKLLLAGVTQTTEPLINYLGAARAAHELKDFERRDDYIQKAYKIAPKEELAIGIVQSELEISQHQYEHAIATLNHLRQLSPRHPRVLFLLEKVYTRLADWRQLQSLLPDLRKAKIITSEQAATFEKNLYLEILRHSTYSSLDALHQAWADLPKAMRNNPDIAYAYVQQLSKFNDTATMEEVIRKILKHSWHGGLVNVYSTLPFTNLNQQLVIMGGWLKSYGNHQELLLALGRVCVKVQLWGKAKDYFERCLEIEPNPEASYEYGALLEHLGDIDLALTQYKLGLKNIEKA